jgi:hypothetical protein
VVAVGRWQRLLLRRRRGDHALAATRAVVTWEIPEIVGPTVSYESQKQKHYSMQR